MQPERAIPRTDSSLNGQINNLIDYPDIMQAISFTDTKVQDGQVTLQSDEARISAWRTSLDSFGDSVVALEQDQVVTIQ